MIAIQILQSSVSISAADGGTLPGFSDSALAAVLYLLAMGALYKFINKYTPLLLVIMGAIAGQFLFA